MRTLHHLAVGILSTGHEILHGDVIDTNAPTIAKQLFESNIPLGHRITVADHLPALTHAIQQLLNAHGIVITIGGLGPTSDDLTRHAISAATQTPLIFNEASWQRVTQRISHAGFTITENNRQQSYFPNSATIFPNQYGTADGCHLVVNNQHIFMLPGPPNECLPMFHTDVMPRLLTIIQPKNIYHSCWRVLGASESVIAEHIERHIDKTTGCDISYCAASPYLTIRLASHTASSHRAHAAIITEILADMDHAAGSSPLSSQLRTMLEHLPKGLLHVVDDATGGALTHALLHPKTQHAICFDQAHSDAQYIVRVDGLNAFWQRTGQHIDNDLILTIIDQSADRCVLKLSRAIPTTEKARKTAVEYIAFWLYRWINTALTDIAHSTR